MFRHLLPLVEIISQLILLIPIIVISAWTDFNEVELCNDYAVLSMCAFCFILALDAIGTPVQF